MLCIILFALWFQDKHAIQVYFTAGNHSDNMPAEYTSVLVFKRHAFIVFF